MTFSKDNLVEMIQGSYKKLKSYYYYDKNFLYIKEQIASFENNRAVFQETMNLIADSIFNQDYGYFNSLIQQVDFVLYSKSLKSTVSPSENQKTITDPEHKKNIEKVNFFIYAPIELLILDTLWMLMVSKVLCDQKKRTFYSYANRQNQGIFKHADSLFEGIDYNSNRCFVPYFRNYSQWQNNAISSIERNLHKSSVIFFALDLKSYYYSVRFSFSSLPKMLNDDNRLADISFITQQIERLYLHYNNIVKEYKPGIEASNDEVFLPIGLLSSSVLSEIYLADFDEAIYQTLHPYYFGRYVDDILIVINADDLNLPQDCSSFDVCEYLQTKGLIQSVGNNATSNLYFFNQYPSIKIQEAKITSYYFKKSQKSITLDFIKKQVQSRSSEVNLMPDFDIIRKRFNDIAYHQNNTTSSPKIRDLGILQSDNYAAARSIALLKQLLKNTSTDQNGLATALSFVDDILSFYENSAAIEYMSSWASVFELLILMQKSTETLTTARNYAKEFYDNIIQYIDRLNFHMLHPDELYQEKKDVLLDKLRHNLKRRLNIAIALALAINLPQESLPPFKDNNLAASLFLKSNLLNHNLVSLPLVNYMNYDVIKHFSLISDFEDMIANLRSEKLDEFCLNWTPRYIHLDELFFHQFIYNLNNELSDSEAENSDCWEQEILQNYCDINKISVCPSIHSNFRNLHESNVNLVEFSIPFQIEGNSDYRIGLVNSRISEDDASETLRDPSHRMTVKDKESVFKMLNTAKNNGANFICFPEFSIPLIWIPEISKYSRVWKISFIAGLRYIHRSNQAFNFTVIIQPSTLQRYTTSVVLFREKNYYAPKEKLGLQRLGFCSVDKKTPLYFIIQTNGFNYGSILCYEFVDIFSRAAFKSKVDALFVPQLNQDTNYFASIVESTARDLHCYVIQANTSIYGDSRITGPFDTEHKNIVQVKGGENDVILIGSLAINTVRDFRDTSIAKFEKCIQRCKCCFIPRTATYPYVFEKCKTCKDNPKKNIIKDTPPNFHS